ETERLDRLGAQPRGDETAVGPELEGELEDGRQALLRRYLHVLAASRREAGEEGAERADGRVQTGLEAGLVAERLERREVGAGGLAVEGRDAARAPGDDVGATVAGVRPGEPEGRDRGHHQRRVPGRQALASQAPARHPPPGRVA